MMMLNNLLSIVVLAVLTVSSLAWAGTVSQCESQIKIPAADCSVMKDSTIKGIRNLHYKCSARAPFAKIEIQDTSSIEQHKIVCSLRTISHSNANKTTVFFRDGKRREIVIIDGKQTISDFRNLADNRMERCDIDPSTRAKRCNILKVNESPHEVESAALKE